MKKSLTTVLANAIGIIAAVVLVFLLPVHPSDAADPPPFGGISRQFTLIEPARPAPWKPFLGADGKDVDTRIFKGKVVLLNFWATWCAPCIEEMPTLDALQAELGSDKFTVVTMSIDGRGLEKVKSFFADLKLKTLKTYLDRSSANYRSFGVRGLPTTFLIDHRGYVIGYLEGPAAWSSGAAKALIGFYLRKADG